MEVNFWSPDDDDYAKRLAVQDGYYNSNETYLCRRCRLTIDLKAETWYDLRGGTQCWGGSTRETHSPWG